MTVISPDNSQLPTNPLCKGGKINVSGALTLQGGGDATTYLGIVGGSYSSPVSSIVAASASISGSGSRWDTERSMQAITVPARPRSATVARCPVPLKP